MKSLILFISLFAFNNSNAQGWQWAKHYGSPGGNEGMTNICLDSSGNVYATGWFERPYCIFGSDTLFPLYPYDSQRLNDFSMFILKVDNSGKVIWCKGEVPTTASGTDIKYDPFSNAIYVASYEVEESQKNYSQWILLEKRDLNGKIIWQTRVNSYNNGANTSIDQMTLDSYGNIYFLGYLQWADIVGAYSLTQGTFLAKYNSSGDCIFAKNISNIDGTYPQQIRYTNSSLIVLGWSYQDTVIVDTAHALSHGIEVSFISRFDTLGNIVWLKTNGGPNIGGTTTFDIDSSGNIYASLFFKDTCYLDNFSLINTYPISLGLSKWNINGELIWAKEIPCTSNFAGSQFYGYANITQVSTDVSGNSYITGYFNHSLLFAGNQLTTKDSSDTFVARYDSSGKFLGALNFGSAAGYQILNDKGGVFYATGTFDSTVNIGRTSLTSYGAWDMYVAKHNAIIAQSPETLLKNGELIIYSNPSNGKCNVVVPSEFLNGEQLVLDVYDNLGKHIQQKSFLITERKIELVLSGIAKGIYNVTVINGEKSYNGRIVLE